MINRDIQVLEHIFMYCKRIEMALNRFGNDFEIFSQDELYQDAVMMNLLQIGELTTHLSED